MKVALFDDFQLGMVQEDTIYELGPLLFGKNPPGCCPMVELIRNYEQYQKIMERGIDSMPSRPLSEVRLRQPVSRPGKIVAAPVNYVSHMKEMNVHHTARGLGFFLKANSSLAGHGEPIVLPAAKAGRRFDHELELAFIIGKTAKKVKAKDAYSYIFGYTGLNDVTLRPDGENEEERCLRKSFDTFTPMGPWIVTSDEIDDPQSLQMELTVNGELRQKTSAREMICGIAELIEIYSHVMTLEPGDIITTGTPDGVSPVYPGDMVKISIDGIGSFSNPVELESPQKES